MNIEAPRSCCGEPIRRGAESPVKSSDPREAESPVKSLRSHDSTLGGGSYKLYEIPPSSMKLREG